MNQVAGNLTSGTPIQLAAHDGEGSESVGDFAGSLAQAGGQSPLNALTQKLDGIIAALAELRQGESEGRKDSTSLSAPVAKVVSQAVGQTGFSLSGNLPRDMQMLQQLAAGNGVNSDLLTQVANAVAGEAKTLGNGNDASVAGGIARDLGRGDYDQQGAVQAITSALLGQHVDPVKNNIQAILVQLASNGDHQSIANNLNALANQVADANPQLSDMVRGLAGQASSGALNNHQAAGQLSQAMNALGADGSAISAPKIGGDMMDLSKELDEIQADLSEFGSNAPSSTGQAIGNTGLSLSGDVSKDMQLLQRLVAGVGTNGNTLVQVANAVSSEAQAAGDSADASVAGGISRDLGRGDYDQQSAVQNITSALLGQNSDPLKNDIASVAMQLKAGEQAQSIENNLNALMHRASDENKSALASAAAWMAGAESAGQLDGVAAAQKIDIA